MGEGEKEERKKGGRGSKNNNGRGKEMRFCLNQEFLKYIYCGLLVVAKLMVSAVTSEPKGVL